VTTNIPPEEWHSEGIQRVEADRVERTRAQFDRDIEYHTKAGSHLWIATVVYRLSQQGAESIAKREESFEPRMDMENLYTVEFGCYICEQPLLRTNVNKRCSGDPR